MDIKTKFDIGDTVSFGDPYDHQYLKYKVFSINYIEDLYSEKWITYGLTDEYGNDVDASEWDLVLIKKKSDLCSHFISRLQETKDKGKYEYVDGVMLVNLKNKFCPECGEKL